jgi:hypothetical protein
MYTHVGVAVGIVQIGQGGFLKISIRFVGKSQFRCKDSEDTGRQGGVMCGDGLIVLKIALLLIGIISVGKKKMGQEKIGLFADLISGDGEGMIVKQQRVMALRCVCEVPDIPSKKNLRPGE